MWLTPHAQSHSAGISARIQSALRVKEGGGEGRHYLGYGPSSAGPFKRCCPSAAPAPVRLHPQLTVQPPLPYACSSLLAPRTAR